jgi:hypothetical protein
MQSEGCKARIPLAITEDYVEKGSNVEGRPHYGLDYREFGTADSCPGPCHTRYSNCARPANLPHSRHDCLYAEVAPSFMTLRSGRNSFSGFLFGR